MWAVLQLHFEDFKEIFMELIILIIVVTGIWTLNSQGIPVTDFINNHPFWTLFFIGCLCSSSSDKSD